MKKYLFNLTSLLILGSISSLQADDDNPLNYPITESITDYHQSFQEEQQQPSSSFPCCVESKWKGYVSIDWLYWQAYEEGLQYVFKATYRVERFETFQLLNGEICEPKIKWKPGFRLGLGLGSDPLDFRLTWLYYHFKTQTSNGIPSSQFYPKLDGQTILFHFKFGIESGYFPITKTSCSWQVKLDLWDLDIGHPFYLSPRFCCRPNVGIKGGFIQQSFVIKHVFIDEQKGVHNTAHDLNQKFAGLGIKMGIEMNYQIGGAFHIYGRSNISLLKAMPFKIDYINRFYPASYVKMTFANKIPTSSEMIDMSLGFNWAYRFTSGAELEIRLGYEQNALSKQNQYQHFSIQNTTEDNLDEPSSATGTLSTFGWTLGMSLTF